MEILKFLIALLTLIEVCSADYTFKTDYHQVPLDHFSYTTNTTFQIKYLYNDTYWNKTGDGPIFFYTGNEGLIEVFAQNTGLMWDLAPKFGALLLFAEHRYYGDSMPFGNESFSSPEKSGYLTSEQALADFAHFLHYYRIDKNATNSPIIAFGGSYGGMLTAWMRIKYPHIIQGGIAASAPIVQFQGLTPCSKYGQIVSADFQRVSNNCSWTIRKSWDIINSFGKTEGGRDWISKTFKVCFPLKGPEEVKKFKEWLVDVYGYLAMIDYPYENSFLEPVPGNPVEAVCNALISPLESDKMILKSIFKGVSIYFNYTGVAECLDYTDEATGDLDAGGWDFQACTEMIMPMCNDGKQDMFEPLEWDLAAYSDDCFKRFGVRPKPYAAEVMYGGRDIMAASNIVFSNGLLDPWYGGGILNNLSDTLIALIIPDGAHHLDLRSSHVKDPKSVITARAIEAREIERWIQEFHSMKLKE